MMKGKTQIVHSIYGIACYLNNNVVKGSGWPWLVYLLVGILATGVYFLLPSARVQNVFYDFVGFSAVAAIALGVHMYRPVRPLHWYVFALGLQTLVVADVIWAYYENILQVENPFPSVADVFYLVGLPCIAAGLVLVEYRRIQERWWSGMTEALIIATVAGVVSWVLLMEPIANDQSRPLLERLVSIAYPLLDLVLLVALLQLLLASKRRLLTYYLLGVSLAFLLIADTVYAVMQLTDSYETGSPIDAGWLLSYVLFGAAALHPSMRDLSEPGSNTETKLTWRRLALLAGTLLIAPLMLTYQALSHEEVNVPVIAGGSMMLLLLVTLRMVGMLKERERADQALRKSEEKYRSVVDNVKEVIFQTDTEGLWTFLNPAWAETTGFLVEESLGTNFLDYVHLEDRQRNLELFRPLVERKKDYCRHEIRYLTKDGSFRWIEVWARLTLDENGAIVGTSGTLNDITERKWAEEKLRESEERFRQLFEHSIDAVFVHDKEGRILDCNRRACQSLGYSREELLALTVRDVATDLLFEDEKRRRKGDTLWERVMRSEPGKIVGFDQNNLRRKDGTTFPVEVGVGAIDYDGRRLILASARDTTERRAFERQLRHQALHDPLTNLPNRTLFRDRLEHALARTKRRKAGKVVVLFMDLDNFKVINDSLGHEAGDQLLVAISERLGACLRPGDTMARLSGDEFALLLEDVRDMSDATRVAERLAEELQTPFALAGREVFVTASIGIAPSNSAQDEPADLLQNADLAMYRAKRNGKAHYEVFDASMSTRALEHLELGNDLRRALERDEFRVYYQPTVRLDISLQHYLRFSGSQSIVASNATEAPRMVGMEALVRWEHPQRGLLSPSEFIPIVEETGLILPIGRWVLGEACRQARAWQEQYPSDPPLMMSVNLSSKQFQHPKLTEDVARILQETGLKPCSLCLEITESVVMGDAQATITTLQELDNLGVQLAVDDFGTGYSSLLYLKRFPIDYLKIDRSFVEALRKNPEDTAIVSGVITLAHTLGMHVIAEGVETAEQLAHLRGLGCDLAQGNYFSKALPSEAASELLATGLH